MEQKMEIVDTLESTAAEQNHYASHLAEVNKSQAVISTEDVYTANGVMLVKKGSRITESVAEKILRHKLIKPLEQQVNLEKSLNETSLRQEFAKLFIKYPDIGRIHTAHDFDGKLKNLVLESRLDAVLFQKLTVLKDQLPDVFEKSIFCAWWCGLIGHHMNLGIKPTQCSFLAGLYHDVGLLHIDPEVLHKRGQLAPAEWRAIQSHVVVGHLMIKQLSALHDETARAILEHHECCDGSGYPAGKTSDALSVPGQIVALADALQAVRINRFEAKGMNMRDALPFLHMNSTKHFLGVYRTACQLIMQGNLPVTTCNPHGSYAELVNNLLGRVDILQDAVVVLSMIREVAQNEDQTAAYRRLESVIDPVAVMIQSSGLVRDELTLWFKKLRDQPDESALRDLIETDLMQSELLWQLKKAIRVVTEYLDNHPVLLAEQRAHLKKLSEYVANSLDDHTTN
jgi:HD-GYP domain-containing protein (c-di-GMP phosphodiesterase class II)